MANDTLKASQAAGGAHHRLGLLIGEWEGANRTWFEPGELADESPVHGTIRPVLDGRFVIHEYASSLTGKPLQGMAIIGYHLDEQKFEVAWLDSFHTGTAIMLSEGPEAKNRISVLGSYWAGNGEPRWDWRTDIEMTDSDHLVITAYNVSPQGDEAKAVETSYVRKR